MLKIGFFAEEGIPYLKDYFLKSGFINEGPDFSGRWWEFSSIDKIAKDLISGKITSKEIEDLHQAVFFIKTSTPFDNRWESLAPLAPLLKKIRIVGTAAVGTDHIDFAYLRKSRIAFYHSPGCNTTAVTDYVFFLILKYCISNQKKLSDLTVGILGLGNIGSILARQLLTLNARVIAFDPLYRSKKNFPRLPKRASLTLLSNEEEVLSYPDLDIITLHVPLTHSGPHPTYHLVNKQTLTGSIEKNKTKKKRKKLLINTSRGGIVDEKSLLPYLANLDYAADVWENEPNFNLRLAQKSLFVTPHIAGYTDTAKQEAARTLFVKVADHLKKNGWKKRIHSPRNREILEPLKWNEVTEGNFSLEKGLYGIFSAITGLQKFHIKMKKSLSKNRKERATEFTKMRKATLRKELGNYKLEIQSPAKEVSKVLKAFSAFKAISKK